MSHEKNSLVDSLRDLHNVLLICIEDIKLETGVYRDKWIVTFYMRIFETAGAITYLYGTEFQNLIPVIYRTLLEAQAKLLCLIKDPNYQESLRLDAIKHDLRIMDLIIQKDPDKALDKQTREQLKEDKNHKKDLLKRGVKSLNTEDLLRKANKPDYLTVYIGLSGDIHSGHRAMDNFFKEEGESHTVYPYNQKTDTKLEIYLTLAGDALIETTTEAFKYFDIEQPEKIAEAINEFLASRS